MAKTKKLKTVKEETYEERVLRLEMEAIAAEENSRKEDEAKRIELRKKQLQEKEYSSMNQVKIHNQWRKIMRMAKVEQLKSEIEILAQTHERELDRKEALIQMLDKDLDEFEEQYYMAFRGHKQMINALQNLQYQRLKQQEQYYEDSVQYLRQQFEKSKADIQKQHAQNKQEAIEVINAMEKEFFSQEQKLKVQFDNDREDIKNKNSEDYNVLKIQLEGIIEELEKQFESAFQSYQYNTGSKSRAFKQLTKNDSQAALLIEKRMKKLLKLSEAIAHWQNKISSMNKEWSIQYNGMRNEKECMHRFYGDLKRHLDAVRNANQQHLKSLSVSSGACINDLTRKIQTGEHIIQLQELCRKYESEQERILSYNTLDDIYHVNSRVNELQKEAAQEENNQEQINVPKNAESTDALPIESSNSSMSRPQENIQQSQNINKQEPLKIESQPPTASPHKTASPRKRNMKCSYSMDENGEIVEQWKYLDKFFVRYNKAFIDKVAIDHQIQRFNDENDQLRKILKQYLDGISVNDEVINNPLNPLIVVNQRLQIAQNERMKMQKDIQMQQ